MSDKKFDVVALGELLIDFVENGISFQSNPLFEANPGGAPCNVLAMLSNLGNKTAFIGKVGDDFFGHMLADTIRECGIGTDGLVFDKNVPTTLALVHKKPDGDRDFSFYRNPGADMMLKDTDIKEKLIEEADLFHFGTLSMTDSEVEKATVKAVDIAKKNGLLISFDPNYRAPLWDNEEKAKEKMDYGFRNCDILKISDDEILFFTGKNTIEEGMECILENYSIKLICATLGKDGSIAFYNGKKVIAKSVPNPNVIETTGAGDTFMGCVIDYCLHHDFNNLSEDMLREMLVRANNAASIITTRKGALKVMPKLKEIHS
ncbi:MAG: carbohydrate kinase [Butyrivibrio sp.]|nr:carbohydrate kinase [Butyrivibrio sp.]